MREVYAAWARGLRKTLAERADLTDRDRARFLRAAVEFERAATAP